MPPRSPADYSPLFMQRVAVIIPALNEADGLRRALPALQRLAVGRIIVADNGSTDDTAAVARAHGATVILEPQRGYGAACQAGIAALTPRDEVVVFMDADASDDPDALPRLVEPILSGRADLVIGCRDPAQCESGALTLQQRWGNWLAGRLIRLRWGYGFRDLGPFRAIRRDSLTRLAMSDRAFGWTVEMQIRALQEKLRIVQIDVPYRRRVGKSKISGTIKGTLLAGYWILKTIARLWFRRD